MWWLMVGWDSSNASFRSQTQASPPSCEATRDISRSRTGSARAFSSGAICPACSIVSTPADSGGQQAADSAGVSRTRDFGMHLYCHPPMSYGKLTTERHRQTSMSCPLEVPVSRVQLALNVSDIDE